VPRHRRAKKAVKAVKEFLVKHMKSDDVRLGNYLNLNIWKHGIKNPPHHIQVEVVKDDKNVVRAELVGAPKDKEKKELKKPEAPKKEEKADQPEAKNVDVKPVETKAPEAKPVPKIENAKDPVADKVPSAAELANKK
jgi:large subunit ribosomal protein L31e